MQLKFFLKKLHHICSSDFQTFYFCRHFYWVRESDYIFSSRRFGHWKTRKTAFFLVFDRLFDVFYQLYKPQYNFILFQTKSMNLSGDFESLPSSIRQNLAPVAPRKVCEGMTFWRILMHFDPFTKNLRFRRNFSWNEKREVLSYNDVRPRVGKLFS